MTNETKQLLHSIPAIIQKTFPVPGRFRGSLPSKIAELSRLLTNNRGERSLSYLNRPEYLSAYLYYFLPWNLHRLCFLLPTLEIKLSLNDTITDIGCGPLTLLSALWITYPNLRKIPLEINCIDRSGPALEAGKKFFITLCESTGIKDIPWKINIIKEEINFKKLNSNTKRKKASLVTAVNIFNEIYEKLPHSNTEGLRLAAESAVKYLHNEAAKNAPILVVEPGIPQAGKFISVLRNEMLKINRPPLSPCTHSAACPYLSGPKSGHAITRGRNWIDTKKRWCHFAFEAAIIPKELWRLSVAAKLPKERLVFSYLFADKVSENIIKNDIETKSDARVISDAFILPENLYGRYGCSKQGLILITGDENKIEKLHSLSLVPQSSLIEFNANIQYDKKSGAIISPIKTR